MSTLHDVILVVVDSIRPHPDADTLSITEVNGNPVVFKTGTLNVNDLAVYFPIDSLLPIKNPVFEFLKKKETQETHRLRACRLRGVFSQGLLIPLSSFDESTQHAIRAAIVNNGSECDLRSLLNVGTYEIDEEGSTSYNRQGGRWWTSGATSGPSISKYDIEGYGKYRRLLTPGEQIVLTEKIHGANARYVYHDGKFYAGSRTQWKREDPHDMWWSILDKYPGMREFLIQYPDHVLFGEVYGQVQDLKYGLDGHSFVAFDIYDMKTSTWLGFNVFSHMTDIFGIPTVPVLYFGPYDPDEDYKAYAEGNSTIPNANHVREGFVLKPTVERKDDRLGRVIMKHHGQGYLLRK